MESQELEYSNFSTSAVLVDYSLYPRGRHLACLYCVLEIL